MEQMLILGSFLVRAPHRQQERRSRNIFRTVALSYMYVSFTEEPSGKGE